MSDDVALARARAAVDEVHSRISQLDDNALDLIFRSARNHNKWQDREVPEALLRQAWDIARMGPTSANGQPMRIVFVRGKEAKEKLRPAMAPANADKTMVAPYTAIVAYDLDYWKLLPRLYPIRDMSAMFKDNRAFAEEHAARNGTLQGAYLIVALRALGLDAGGMSGFNRKAVDDTFFAGTAVRSNFLINIGYGHSDGIMGPRLPRLEFDEGCKIV